jgi:hypothetical protein
LKGLFVKGKDRRKEEEEKGLHKCHLGNRSATSPHRPTASIAGYTPVVRPMSMEKPNFSGVTLKKKRSLAAILTYKYILNIYSSAVLRCRGACAILLVVVWLAFDNMSPNI